MYIKYYINLTYNENVVYDWNYGTLIPALQRQYCYKEIVELFKVNGIDAESIASIKVYSPSVRGYVTLVEGAVLKMDEYGVDDERGIVEMVLTMKNRNDYYEQKIQESVNDIRNMSMCLQKAVNVNSNSNSSVNWNKDVEKRKSVIVQYFYTKILVDNNGSNFRVGSAYTYEIEVIKEQLSQASSAELYVDVLTNESCVEGIARCPNIIVVNTYGEYGRILHESCFDNSKNGTYNEVSVMEFLNSGGISKCDLVILINCNSDMGEYIINRKLMKNVIVVQSYTRTNDYNEIQRHLKFINDLFHFIVRGYNVSDSFSKAKCRGSVNDSCCKCVHLHLNDGCSGEVKFFNEMTTAHVDEADSPWKCECRLFNFGVQTEINSLVYKVISTFVRITFIYYSSFQFMTIMSGYVEEYYVARKVIARSKIEIHLWRTLLNECSILKSIHRAINTDAKFHSVKDVYSSIKHKKWLIVIYCHKCYIDNASAFVRTLTAFTENTFSPRVMFCFDNNIATCNELTKHEFTSITLDSAVFHKVIANTLSSLLNTPLLTYDYMRLFNEYLKQSLLINGARCLQQCELVIYVFALCGVSLIGRHLSCYDENCFELLVNAHIMRSKDNVVFELNDDICDYNKLLGCYKRCCHKQSLLILVQYVDVCLNGYLRKLCCDLNKDIDMHIDLPLLSKCMMLNTRVNVDLVQDIECVLYLLFFDNKGEVVPSLDLILKVMLYFKYKRKFNEDTALMWLNHFKSSYSDNETICPFLSLFDIRATNRTVIPIKYDNVYLYYYSLIINKTNGNEDVPTLLNEIIQFSQSTDNACLTQLLFVYVFDMCLANKNLFHHSLTVVKHLKPSAVAMNRIKAHIYIQLCQFNISICNLTKSQLYYTNAKALVTAYDKGTLYMKLTTLHKQLLVLSKHVHWNHIVILHSNPLVCFNSTFSNYHSATSFISHFHKLSSLHKHIPFTYKPFTKRAFKQAITEYSGNMLILKSNDFMLQTKTNSIVIESNSKESKLLNYETVLSLCDTPTIQYDIVILAFICDDMSQYVNLCLSKGAQCVIVLTAVANAITDTNCANVTVAYEESVNVFIIKFIKEYIQRRQMAQAAFDSANDKLQRRIDKRVHSFMMSEVYYNSSVSFHLSLFNMLYYVKGNICSEANPGLVAEDIVRLNKQYGTICGRNLDLYNVLSLAKRNEIKIINVHGRKDSGIDSFVFHLYYLFAIEFPMAAFTVTCVNKKRISDLCCSCKEMKTWRYVFIDGVEGISDMEAMRIVSELVEAKCKVIVRSKSKIQLGLTKETNMKVLYYELGTVNHKRE